MNFEQLLGPTGVAVVALIAAGVLWRDHLRADADDRSQRDVAFGLVRDLIPEVKKLAEAQLQANRDKRRDDS